MDDRTSMEAVWTQCLSPEGLVCDLMDVQTKELFGSVFEHVFQEALWTAAFVPHQSHVSSLSQPAVKISNIQQLFRGWMK